MVELRPVVSKADWETFIDFPWKVYSGDARWVPPLRIQVRDMLDLKKNPFFTHACMHPVLAYKNDACVGRVVAVVDEDHNKFHEEKTGFFGFFECVDDQEVANALLDESARWVKEKGMSVLRGPVNLSTNNEAGLLVEGYDDPPTVMMTYNPRYYSALLEKWGLAKSMDLFAYNIHGNSKFSDRLLAHAQKLKQGSNVRVRTIDMSKFEAEVDVILDIYNDAWEKNWGFVPMSPKEFEHLAADMKPILDPKLLFIVEVRGAPAAFSLALPDINQAMIKIRDGKLFPTGLAKLLWHLKGPARRKTINRCRVITLGIKQAYREVGIGPLLYAEYLREGPANGYPIGEASWILENNKAMNKALQHMCGERTKVYRIYDRAIAE